jgi:hypothetical protein
MKFADTAWSREHRFSIGRELESGRPVPRSRPAATAGDAARDAIQVFFAAAHLLTVRSPSWFAFRMH